MEAESSVGMIMLEKGLNTRFARETDAKFIKEKKKKDQGFILNLNTNYFPDKSNEI